MYSILASSVPMAPFGASAGSMSIRVALPIRTRPGALSVVYRAVVPAENINPIAGKRIAALARGRVDDAIAKGVLAFDRSTLVLRAVESTRAKVRGWTCPSGSYASSSRSANCSRAASNCSAGAWTSIPIAEGLRTGAKRPAQIYQLRAD